jgi:hypothetical protein
MSYKRGDDNFGDRKNVAIAHYRVNFSSAIEKSIGWEITVYLGNGFFGLSKAKAQPPTTVRREYKKSQAFTEDRSVE